MQNCPACQHLLPTDSVFFYCPNCPQQVRCKACEALLLLDAKRCVMCGVAVGESSEETTKLSGSNGSVPIPAVNTLKFSETKRGHSREIEVTVTNEVGVSWGGPAIAAIVGGHIAPTKTQNNRPTTSKQLQQLSLLENPVESTAIPIDSTAQLLPAQNPYKRKFERIFRQDGGQLKLIETRLKAENKLDAARRVVFLALLYSSEIERKQEMPRSNLNNILKTVGLYDGNSSHWISTSPDLLVEEDKTVGLRISGEEKAQKILNEVLDPSIEDKWNLKKVSGSRNSKSNYKDSEDTGKSSKQTKTKTNQCSKEVETWITAWQSLSSTLDPQPNLQECNTLGKGLFGIWAISKSTNDSDIIISSYKLQQFLYFGLGLKVDERGLGRALKSISGQGNLIKVRGGFQLLAPGHTHVEKMFNLMQSPSTFSAENSSSVEEVES